MILSVNVDHVATLRQARLAQEPDPVMAATLALLGGADGITVHLREDRRHINDSDLRRIRELVHIELNLEMAATEEMIDIALSVVPDMVTLVPEKRQELTTEGGLDVRAMTGQLTQAVSRLQAVGIPVSLFINPYPQDVEAAKKTGAQMIELHTGLYANARTSRGQEAAKVRRVVDMVGHLGLIANAGHGLNYTNVVDIARIPGIRGLYIGHSIVSRAVLVGMERAVAQMKHLVG